MCYIYIYIYIKEKKAMYEDFLIQVKDYAR